MNMRSHRALGNIISSFFKQAIAIVLGFVIPKLVVVNLGSEANGLLSTVNQALAYATLLEAGVGLASLQSLYKPVANGDRESINSVISATVHFYRKTALYYLIAVVIMAIFLPQFIQATEISKLTMSIIILICGIPGAVSFYFQGAYKVLLNAEGKTYIVTNVATISYILTNVLKILLLVNGYGIIPLQISFCCVELLGVLFITAYMKKNYSWIDFRSKPNWDSIAQKNSVLIHQISGMIFNHTDVLILSFFCGLSTVSVYSVYAMIYAMIVTFIENFDGVKFILGQNFHNEKDTFKEQYEYYEVFNMTLTFALFTIANIFIIPFMKIYTVGMSDAQYINLILPYLFLAQYTLSSGRNASAAVIIFASHFKETRWHAIVEMSINIVVSVLGVLFFGIYGVIIGTIVALLFRTVAMVLYANKVILKRNPWITVKRWIINLSVSLLIILTSNSLMKIISITNYFTLIGWAVVFGISVLILFLLTVLLFERDTFKYFRKIIHL